MWQQRDAFFFDLDVSAVSVRWLPKKISGIRNRCTLSDFQKVLLEVETIYLRKLNQCCSRLLCFRGEHRMLNHWGKANQDLVLD